MQENLEYNLSKIGIILKQVIPSDHSFVLMVFEHDPKGDLYYISDLEQKDSTKMMNEHGISRELIVP